MSKFPTEKARLIKQDSSVIDGVEALFSRDMIFVDDASVCIEDGDTFERTLPNGIKEHYLVLDSGFFSGSSTIPAHYQAKVEKQTHYRKTAIEQTMSSPPVNDTKGISINASSGAIIQIQQNSVNSTQTFIPSQAQNIDYTAISDFLKQVHKYPMLADELGDDATKFEQLVAAAEEAIENKAAPSKIKAVLDTMKDLMVGITGSLIASGIATQIPVVLSQAGL